MSGAPTTGAKRGGDVSYRRTWDVEKYARLGEARDAIDRREGRERREAALRGDRYPPRDRSEIEAEIAATAAAAAAVKRDPDEDRSEDDAGDDDRRPRVKSELNGHAIKREIKSEAGDEKKPVIRQPTAPRAKQDFSSVIGKNYLVPVGASVGRRGKGAGFYCSQCDETYKDNAGWLDHLNSPQHLRRTGQSNGLLEARDVTLEQCLARLEQLKAAHFAKLDKIRKATTETYDLDATLAERQAEEDRRLEQRREQRRARKEQQKIKQEPEDDELQGDADVMAAMGFRGFT